jgi:2-succinyl-6-hydroxy-2,4-cyclohexadiene-1-carboxylate synthase
VSKTIYFIPGTMCDQKLWLPAWQLLREQCREDFQLIHLVIPIVGNMDDVVSELSKKIITDQAILVGFSLGGYIASAIALALGHRLKQLLIVSNFPKNLPTAEIKQRKRTVAWINQRGYSGIPSKRINDLLHANIQQFNSQGYQDIQQTIVDMDRELGVKVLVHQLSVSLHRPNILPLLTQLTLPITFLVGDADHLVELSTLKQALEGATNIALKEVADTGHMLPLESPQALASTLIDLLSR